MNSVFSARYLPGQILSFEEEHVIEASQMQPEEDLPSTKAERWNEVFHATVKESLRSKFVGLGSKVLLITKHMPLLDRLLVALGNILEPHLPLIGEDGATFRD